MKCLSHLSFVLLLSLLALACNAPKKSLKDPYKDLKSSLPLAKVTLLGDTIRVVYPEVAMFDFGKADLRADARPAFTTFSNILKRYQALRVHIAGYTDNVGPDNVNYELSRRRAETAHEFFRNQGIATSRLSTSGRGPENPVMSNETELGRQTNRRVEFLLY